MRSFPDPPFGEYDPVLVEFTDTPDLPLHLVGGEIKLHGFPVRNLARILQYDLIIEVFLEEDQRPVVIHGDLVLKIDKEHFALVAQPV